LECNKHTIEEAKKVTMVMCEHLCSTFTMEHEAKYYGSGNERRGRVIDRDDAGDMLIQEDYRY